MGIEYVSSAAAKHIDADSGLGLTPPEVRWVAVDHRMKIY
jgi:hypothetical protein